MIRNKTLVPAEGMQEDENRKYPVNTYKSRKFTDYGPFVGLVAIVLFFALVTKGNSVSSDNLSLVSSQCFSTMIASVGAVFVYSHGGFDFSLGSVQAMCILLTGVITLHDFRMWPIALVACIALSAFCSLIIGAARVYLRIPAFVASLCMSYIGRGVIRYTVERYPVSVNTQMAFLNSAVIKVIVVLVVIVIGVILFEYTALGKNLKAIGGNTNAAIFAGVNVGKCIIIAHVILGITVGILSFINTGRQGLLDGNVGMAFEMDVMIALVLGGLPLVGGAGAKMRAAVIGSILVTVLSNGFILWGAPITAIQGIKGVILLVCMYVSYFGSSKGKGIAVN